MKHLQLSRLLRALSVFFSLLFSLVSYSQVQTPKYNTSMGTHTNGYYEYLPAGYTSSSQSYPLIIFLHGSGEVGDGSASQLPAVLRNGPPKLISQGTFPSSFTVGGQTFSFIVLSPQFTQWPDPSDIDQIISYAIKNYRVDVNRIYLTGLSMGGGVVWNYAGDNATYANRLAAIVPVCGASYPDQTRSNIIAAANIKVWATHNDNDPTVPSSYTIGYVNNINSAPVPPSVPAKKTIFQSTSHDAWTTTYSLSFTENNLNVYQWMLQYSKGGSSPTNIVPVANAGTDQTITLPTNLVTLNGSASNDPDGSIVSYSWSFVSGPSQYSISNTSAVNPTLSNLVAGTYTFRLTVTDNKGATATDNVNIIVNNSSSSSTTSSRIEAENYVAAFSMMTQTTSDAGGGLNVGGISTGSWMDYDVNLLSSGSYTFNVRVATPNIGGQLQLKKTDGTILTTVNLPSTNGWQTWATVSTTVNLSAGSQRLRIYCASGSWNFNWFELIPSGTANLRPVVNAGQDQSITLPQSSVTLSGSATDQDGTIASYQWSKISGGTATITTSTSASTTVTGLVQGTYLFELKATDNSGATSADTMQVIVNAATQQSLTRYIKVNVYGGVNPYNNAAWNDWNVGSATASNITSSSSFKYSDGTSSSVSTVLSQSQAVGDNNASYKGGMAPAEVLRYTSYSSSNRTLTISGLSTSRLYDIELYASRYSTGNSTIFTIGSVSQTIVTYDNFTNKARFTSIAPNAQGQIIVQISKTNTYSYLNGFTITEQGSDYVASAASVRQAEQISQSTTEQQTLKVFPNPITQRFTLQINNSYQGTVHISLINTQGITVKHFQVVKKKPVYAISVFSEDLNEGVYILKVQTNEFVKSINLTKLK